MSLPLWGHMNLKRNLLQQAAISFFLVLKEKLGVVHFNFIFLELFVSVSLDCAEAKNTAVGCYG